MSLALPRVMAAPFAPRANRIDTAASRELVEALGFVGVEIDLEVDVGLARSWKGFRRFAPE